MADWNSLDRLDKLFVVWAFLFQIVFIVHFALREPFFESYTIKFGVHPSRANQYYSLTRWKKLVILVRGFSFHYLCCFRLLD
jgi:hypothetical protein